MPPSFSKNLEGLGCDCRVRPAHSENSSKPTSKENLCKTLLGDSLSGPLFYRVWEGFQEKSAGDSKQNARQKSAEKIRRKIREKKCAGNPPQNPPQNPPKIPPENPSQNPPWKRAPSSRCDRLSVAVRLCHRPGLFWMFNSYQASTFRCEIQSKIHSKNRLDPLQNSRSS